MAEVVVVMFLFFLSNGGSSQTENRKMGGCDTARGALGLRVVLYFLAYT
jgi:hypothetical protein